MTNKQQVQSEAQSAFLANKPSNNEGSRPSWTCVMDIDNELDSHKDLPSIMRTSGSPRRRSASSSVSFSPNAELTVIEYPEDHDRQQETYTVKDEYRFKKAARKEVAAFLKFKSGSATPAQRHHLLCLVGIEQYVLSPNFDLSAHARALVRYAVLSEQACLKGFVGDKAAYIADVSRHCSKQSASRAKMIGDFQFIQSRE